jgi:hypothetical protein
MAAMQQALEALATPRATPELQAERPEATFDSPNSKPGRFKNNSHLIEVLSIKLGGYKWI